MDRLLAMQIFVRVARLTSFTAAARELRLSTTAVSRHVAQLEAQVGVQLLRRTTRRLSLTDAGAVYLERCEQILGDVRELEESVREGRQCPRGRLRISVGVSFAQEQLDPLMPRFLRDHPDLEVDLHLTDRHVDLVAEGIDVALRIGQLPDSGLHARRLAPIRHLLCASPDYVAEFGTVTALTDLPHHRCIIDRNLASHRWAFEGPTGRVDWQPQGRYRVNSAHAACHAAEAGVGLAYLPTFVAGPRVCAGTLVPQLPHHRGIETSLHAVYPENRYLSAGVRVLIDTLHHAFGTDPPPWDEGWGSGG